MCIPDDTGTNGVSEKSNEMLLPPSVAFTIIQLLFVSRCGYNVICCSRRTSEYVSVADVNSYVDFRLDSCVGANEGIHPAYSNVE